LARRAAAKHPLSIWFRGFTIRPAVKSASTATTSKTLTLNSLRANIAHVGQDVFLFDDTVAANIAYGGKRDAAAVRLKPPPAPPTRWNSSKICRRGSTR
jgi:hypothetical protein